MTIEYSVHKKYVIALIFCRLDIRILVFDILSVQINQLFVLVSLGSLYFLFVILKSKVLSLHILQLTHLVHSLIELLVAYHTIFYEDCKVVPFFQKLFFVVLIHLFQLLGNLFGNMGRDFLYISVRLQVRTRHIQRNIGRVQNSSHQHHVLGNNSLNAVCNKHLIAIELYLLPCGVYVLFYLWKVKYSGKIERIIDIKMNVEERFVKVHRI